MADIAITLTPPQGKIKLSKKRYKIVNAGRRFGKSFVSGVEIVDTSLSKENAVIWYVAPTLGMGRDIMWNP